MKNKQPLTVTIGVPAYNEEANIANLLKSVLRQKGKLFRIEKIIVICEGSTDNTATKVRNLAKKHPVIKLLAGKKRLGKALALNRLYQANTSDIVVTLDADIILSEPKVIAKMVSAFKNQKVVVVSANNQPIKAKTLIERIYNAGYRMWYEIRKDYKNGHNLYGFQGMAMALRRSFTKSFKFPKIIGDGDYVYLMAKKQKKQVRFIKNAIVLFRSVNNLNDYLIQTSRNLDIKNDLIKYFEKQISEETRIPAKHKITGILKTLYLDPIYTSLSLLVNLLLRLPLFRKNKYCKDGVWKIAESTKKEIIIN